MLFRSLVVLKLGAELSSVQNNSSKEHDNSYIFEKYPGCCERIGKLKNYQVKISIDRNVSPVAQPLRRMQYHLRDKLCKKRDELVALDIIEEVSGPSS